jgi:D-alanyl-lipoteichoic acid acyltransferase DltB (MBOAT superfamily)
MGNSHTSARVEVGHRLRILQHRASGHLQVHQLIVDNIKVHGEFAWPDHHDKVHLPWHLLFTFHCISYIMDIYRRIPAADVCQHGLFIPCTPNWWRPHRRYKDIATAHKRHVDMARFSRGVQRFVTGLG